VEGRFPRPWHGNGRQLLADFRRCRGCGGDERGSCPGSGNPAAGAPGGLRLCGLPAGGDGDRSGVRDPQGAETGGSQFGPDRPDRIERGVRRAGARCDQGFGPCGGPRQREWRRDCAGASAGMHGGQTHRRADPGAQTPEGQVRDCDDVRRGRHGRRGYLRKSQLTEGTLMAATNVPVMAKRVKGGSFLTEERDPQDVFTPEDLSEEHRQIAKTAIDFTQNEVMPAAAEIEAKNFEVTRGLLRKAGELGLMAVDIPEAYGGLEMDKVTSALIAESISKLASF